MSWPLLHIVSHRTVQIHYESELRGSASCRLENELLAWGATLRPARQLRLGIDLTVLGAMLGIALFLVPCLRPDCALRGVFMAKLSIIVHNFTHQVFDQLLSHRAVLLAG
jgi:hypothetical protein